ncbi:MAG TPA: hypothetical protein VHX62_10070 [Solirubrobacteraceae bacterium]|nr:hypothetical protein [Solirubrobacteraceae bacterium]
MPPSALTTRRSGHTDWKYGGVPPSARETVSVAGDRLSSPAGNVQARGPPPGSEAERSSACAAVGPSWLPPPTNDLDRCHSSCRTWPVSADLVDT